MGETIHMKELTLLEWALLKLVIYHIQNVLRPTLLASIFTDGLGLRRYRVECPGNRFGNCKQWRKVHINCLCSRGFDHVTKQLGENLLIFTACLANNFKSHLNTKPLQSHSFMSQSVRHCWNLA